jgi:hypothetical protein
MLSDLPTELQDDKGEITAEPPAIAAVVIKFRLFIFIVSTLFYE